MDYVHADQTFRLTAVAGHDVIASAIVGDVEADGVAVLVTRK